MNYQAAVEFLFEQLPMYQRKGASAIKEGLDGITDLLKLLGNPQEDLKLIHIGGTNGKGSTCHILSSLLQEHGFKVGMYTSPHYRDYRERIKINSTLIGEDKILEYVNEHKKIIEQRKYSFFEWSFAFSLLYFKESAVDYAIIEVGMGGRLDSTNIIEPILTGITNIGLDHTQYLGDTLEDIAYEKAGIIKDRIPVVIGKKQNESASCFKEISKKNKAPMVYSDQMVEILQYMGGEFVEFSIQGEDFNCKFDLFGDYQMENLKMALAMYRIFCLEEDLYMMEPESYGRALSSIAVRTAMQGRMQIVSKNPWVVLDGAHNYEGFEAMMNSLEQFSYEKLFMLVAMVKDKNHHEILSLVPSNAIVISSTIQVPRSEEGAVLDAILDNMVQQHWNEDSIENAYKKILELAGPRDMVLVCGSIFTVGEWLDHFHKNEAEVIS